MFRDLLTLASVQVAREVYTADGMGGGSVTTALTTLGASALWQIGGGKSFLSDKIAAVSSHVLAVEPDTYTWASTDTAIVYAGQTYRITARPDDVANRDELVVVALERIV